MCLTITYFNYWLNCYRLTGAEIWLEDGNPWSVLVITPTMKRARKLTAAKEIVFCDTSSSCDTKSTAVTVISIATKAGAVPIASLLHSDLTEEYYPDCFGGSYSPQSFMTDDRTAEKNALRRVWPEATKLLCQFHVAQAEWRWLLDSKNNISQTVVKI